MRRSQAERYLQALAREAQRAPAVAVETIFLGGGTPNAHPPEQLARLLALLRERFAIHQAHETTIELNPEPAWCDESAFAAYRAAGIDRLSFGVQSLEASELRTLGRTHSGSDVGRVVARARAAGFENLSLDLIFGVPGQSRESWSRTLEAALTLEPTHLSAYGLEVEPGTPFWDRREAGPADFPGEDLEADLYEFAIERLEAAGYEHYEISNFARPGFRCAHNLNYWRDGEYLGLGVGAASFLGGERRANLRDLERYLAALEAGEAVPAERERLAGAARLGEATMLALRTREGVDCARFAERYGVDFMSFYQPVIAELGAEGLLAIEPPRVHLTRRGRFLANAVCGAFVNFRGAAA